MKRFLILAAISALTACGQQAQTGGTSVQLGAATAAYFKDAGATVLATQPSEAFGLTLVLAEKDGVRKFVYESADKTHLIIGGSVIDEKGNSTSARDVIALMKANPSIKWQEGQVAAATGGPQVNPGPAPQPQVAAQVDPNLAWSIAEKAKYVSEGKGRVVYIAFDPNCPFCQSLYQKTRSVLNNVEIRWIPFAALGHTDEAGNVSGVDSTDKVVDILNGDAANLAAIESGMKPNSPVSGLSRWSEVNNAGRSIGRALSAGSVPITLFKDGDTVKFVVGVPNDEAFKIIFG